MKLNIYRFEEGTKKLKLTAEAEVKTNGKQAADDLKQVKTAINDIKTAAAKPSKTPTFNLTEEFKNSVANIKKEMPQLEKLFKQANKMSLTSTGDTKKFKSLTSAFEVMENTHQFDSDKATAANTITMLKRQFEIEKFVADLDNKITAEKQRQLELDRKDAEELEKKKKLREQLKKSAAETLERQSRRQPDTSVKDALMKTAVATPYLRIAANAETVNKQHQAYLIQQGREEANADAIQRKLEKKTEELRKQLELQGKLGYSAGYTNASVGSAIGGMVTGSRSANSSTMQRALNNALPGDQFAKLMRNELTTLKVTGSRKYAGGEAFSNILPTSMFSDVMQRTNPYALFKNADMSGVNSALEDTKNKIKDINDEANKSPRFIDKMTKSFNNLAAVKLVYLWRSFKRITQGIIDAIDKAAEYEESLNLYTMALGEYADDAKRWSDEITDKLMLDPSQVMQYTGAFFNLTKGMGVASKHAFTMSKNLTQLTYDMSSYLNISVDAAQAKIQSAMAGQSRAVQSVGVATQQASLQELAYSLGIKESVRNMTQADKTYLRYIQLLKDTTHMQGDLGATMITPANAIRILKTQLSLLAREFGRVLIPIVMKAIPYIMAFTNILRKAAESVASFFGYKVAPVNYKDGLVDISDGFDKIGDSAGNAKDKIKNSLAPFDELNVVQTDSSSNSDGGFGSRVNIDWGKILPEYDMLERYNGELKETAEQLETRVGNVLKIAGSLYGAFKLIKGVGTVTGWVSKAADGLKKFSSFFGFTKSSKAAGVKETLDGASSITKSANETGKSFNLPSWSTVGKGLAELAAIVTAVGAYVAAVGWLLTTFPSIKEWMSEGSSALSSLFLNVLTMLPGIAGLSYLTVTLSKTKPSDVAKGFADLAIIIGGTEALILATGMVLSIPYFMGFLDNGISAMQKTLNGIAEVALPLAGLTIALGAAGMLGGLGAKMIATGLGDLAIVIAGTEIVMLATGGLLSIPGFMSALNKGIDAMIRTMKGITEVALPLAGLSVALMAAGLTGGIGIVVIAAGLIQLAEVIAGAELVMVAIGKLNKIPGFKQLADEGIKITQHVFEGLGGVIGAAIKGLINKAVESLPNIGKQLSNFMTEGEGFFTGLSKIDANTLKATECLGNMILSITKAELLDGVLNFLEAFTGKKDLTKFGDKLVAFAPKLKEFSDNVKGIDESKITAAANAAKLLAEFTKALPSSGGGLQWFTGEKDLGSWSNHLATLGKGLVVFQSTLQKGKFDAKSVEDAANAAKSLAEFTNNLPTSGGAVKWFTGEIEMTKWANTLPTLGLKIAEFSNNVKDINEAKVKGAANAAKALAEFTQALPKDSNAVSAWFTGSNQNLATFGSRLDSFGQSFKNYYNSIKELKTGTINEVTKSLKEIVAVAKTISDSKLVTTLGDFGSNLKSAGVDIKTYVNNGFSNSQADSIGSNFGKRIATSLKTAFKENVGKIKFKLSDSSGTKISDYTLNAYANGGFPKAGDLFLANEAGPEYVTSIGNKTAVANQDQMINALTNAIVAGFKELGGNNAPQHLDIHIGNDKVYSGQVEYQNRQSDRYGTTSTLKI